MMHDNDLERFNNRAQNGGAEWLIFTESLAKHKPASDICVVKGASGEDCGIMQLINLMQSHGTRFYRSTGVTGAEAPKGLIAPDDVIIVKVNSQWDERGGTNTDLLKA